jgi:hypothetical protein
VTVLIRRRVRNDEYAEEEAVWPKGWPLPQEGSILLGHSVSGRVEHVEWDLPNLRVLVVVRP